MDSDGTNQMINLNGQVAIVTGGGRGIGRAIAQALARTGAAVAVVARTANQLAETVALIEEAGGRAVAFPADVSDQRAIERTVAQVRSVGSLGDIVLAVLTRDHYKWWVWGQDFPPELAERFEQEWLQMQKELAELSSNSTHVIVKDADHWIQEDQPAAVTDAVRRIVESVRGD